MIYGNDVVKMAMKEQVKKLILSLMVLGIILKFITLYL